MWTWCHQLHLSWWLGIISDIIRCYKFSGWLATENLKGWLTRHGKLEGMVDSARKNLQGWLTRHGKFVLTRHGKTWRDGWLGTEKCEGMVDSVRKTCVDSAWKIWRDVSDVCLLVTFSSVKWLTRYGKTIGVKDKKRVVSKHIYKINQSEARIQL